MIAQTHSTQNMCRFGASSTPRKRFYSDNRREEPSPKKIKVNKTSEQKCYNCKERGHFAQACSKPRIECTKCKRLGHTEKDCHRGVIASKIVATNGQPFNKIYFVDCTINEEPSRAYVDTGCGAVLTRQDVTQHLELTIVPSSVTIAGYGASVVPVIGEIVITLGLYRVKANVKAFVVPNVIQEIPVMIGQPFLNLPDVILIVANDQLKVLTAGDDIAKALNVKPRKIPLWAKGVCKGATQNIRSSCSDFT